MIEGCKHGPTDLVPQPCVDCERERLSSEGATHRFAERLSELAPVGGTDDQNAPASALPDVPTVGDLDPSPFRLKDDAFNLGEPRYPKTLTPDTLTERIAQWREQATCTPGNLYEEGRANAFDRCADELESALRACAEALQKEEKNDELSRSETPEISDRLQSSASTDGVLTTPAPERCLSIVDGGERGMLRCSWQRGHEGRDHAWGAFRWHDGELFFGKPVQTLGAEVVPTTAPTKDVGAYLGSMADGACFGSDPEHECHEVLAVEHWCKCCLASEILAWHDAEVRRYLKLANASPPRAEALAPSPSDVQEDASRVDGVPSVGHGDLPREDRHGVISAPAPTLAERIVQWREQSQRSQRDADMARRVDDGAEGMYLDGRAFAFERCADEAELCLKSAAALVPSKLDPAVEAQLQKEIAGALKERRAIYEQAPETDRTEQGRWSYRAQCNAAHLADLVQRLLSLRAAALDASPSAPRVTVQRDVVMTAVRIANREKRLNLAEDSINAITQEVVDAYASPSSGGVVRTPERKETPVGGPIYDKATQTVSCPACKAVLYHVTTAKPRPFTICDDDEAAPTDDPGRPE
jgi:hypothetical protein